MKTKSWLMAAVAVAVFVPLNATVASASGGSGGGGGTASGADLQVGGSASTNSPNPGAAFTYTFQVKNSGPDAATTVMLNDPLPAGTTPNYATANGSTLPCAAIGDLAGGASYRCDLGSIAKGGQATVVVSVNAPNSAMTFSNTATVTSASVDPNLVNNAATVTVQVKAPTGGICKAGVCDTAPTPVAAPCATLTNVSAPVGYYSVWAAIWNTMTVTSCSTSSESVTLEVIETNQATGLNDYDVVLPLTYLPGQNQSLVLDNDFAAFSTNYTITMKVSDSAGNVLALATVFATTPPPR
jgi:uncharacterized repeat protein (TIGR01451 family)